MRDEGVALEVHLGDQPLREAAAEQGEVDVRRPPGVDEVAERVGAGLHGAESVVAIGVGHHPAAAAEVGVDGGQIGVVDVAVAPAGVGLPDLDQGVRHAAPVLVPHPAVDDRPFPDGFAAVGVVAHEVVVQRPQCASWPKRGPVTSDSEFCRENSASRGERSTVLL